MTQKCLASLVYSCTYYSLNECSETVPIPVLHNFKTVCKIVLKTRSNVGCLLWCNIHSRMKIFFQIRPLTETSVMYKTRRFHNSEVVRISMTTYSKLPVHKLCCLNTLYESNADISCAVQFQWGHLMFSRAVSHQHVTVPT